MGEFRAGRPGRGWPDPILQREIVIEIIAITHRRDAYRITG